MDKYKKEKPWGDFEQFTKNKHSTVKIINVNPHAQLSLQYHKNRDEFWRVIQGRAQVVIGENIFEAKEGDEFHIPKETKHRILTKDSPFKILEIAFGDFDEEDIVRLEDKYGRIRKV